MYRAAFAWWLVRGSAETLYIRDFTYRNINILGILASNNHLQARARASDAKYGYIPVGRGQGKCTELPLRGGWYVGVQKHIIYAISPIEIATFWAFLPVTTTSRLVHRPVTPNMGEF